MLSEKRKPHSGFGARMRLCLLEKETGPDPSCWAEPVCCHDFRVYTCKRASSGGKSPEEAVKSNAVVHGNRFHNGFNIHLSREKVNRPSHLFPKKQYATRFQNSITFLFIVCQSADSLHREDEGAFVVRGGGIAGGIGLDVDAESLILRMGFQPAVVGGVIEVM